MSSISEEELYRKCEELVKESPRKEFSARELADALNAGLTPEQQDQQVDSKSIRKLDVKQVGESGEGLRKKKVSDKWIFLFQKGEVIPSNPSPKKDPDVTKPLDQPDEPHPPEVLFKEGGELDLRIQMLEPLAPGNMCMDRTELLTLPVADAETYYYTLAAHVWMVNKDWYAFQVQPILFRMRVLEQQVAKLTEEATKAQSLASDLKTELDPAGKEGKRATALEIELQKAHNGTATKPATVPPTLVPPVLLPPVLILRPSRTWNVMPWIYGIAGTIFLIVGTWLVMSQETASSRKGSEQLMEKSNQAEPVSEPQPTGSAALASDEFDVLLKATEQPLKTEKESQ